MAERAETGWTGRLLAVLGVLVLAGVPLGLGIALERRAVPPPGRPAGPGPGARLSATVGVLPGPEGRLRISDGPRLERADDGTTYVVWRTSTPADSCVLYGRSDAVEHVAAKDGRLVVEHRFALPGAEFAPLCRIRVMSVDATGEVASGDLGPGQDVFAEAPVEYDPFRELRSATAFVWADWDGDARLDVAMCRQWDGSEALKLVAVWDGRLAWRVGVRPAAQCRRVHLADFDADGRPDLLAAGDSLAVYRNQGPPDWGLSDAVIVGQGGASACGSAVADLDGDGLPDVLSVSASGELLFYRNEGRPSVRFAAPAAVWQTVSRPSEAGPVLPVIPADFTGDGRVDVCVLSGVPAILVGGPEGYAPLEGAFQADIGHGIAGMWAEAADWDGDGDMDLYVAGATGGMLLENDGIGRFGGITARAGELAHLRSAVGCGAWADFDGNGYPDLLLGLSGGGVRLYLNDGRGRFMDASGLCALPAPPDASPVGITAVDLDGDCVPDVQVVLSDQRALLLENRWWASCPGVRRSHIKVRPLGERGLCGSVVSLRGGATGRVLASSRIALGGTGAGEHCFGVMGLPAGAADKVLKIEVAFSDGLLRSALWRVSDDSPAVVTVSRTVDAGP